MWLLFVPNSLEKEQNLYSSCWPIMSICWKSPADRSNLQILESLALLKGQIEIYEFPYLPLALSCSTASKFRGLKMGVERKESKTQRWVSLSDKENRLYHIFTVVHWCCQYSATSPEVTTEIRLFITQQRLRWQSTPKRSVSNSQLSPEHQNWYSNFCRPTEPP